MSSSAIESIVAVRKVLPIPVVLFNLILALIAVVDLARGYAVDSYIGASYFLCITSILAILVLSLVSLANAANPGWMAYALMFELSYISIVLMFQFLSATVISSESLTALCRTGDFITTGGYDMCPTHHATLAFAWMAFILLMVHLTLIIIDIRSTAAQTRLSPFAVLATSTAELLDMTDGEFGRRPGGDLEKSMGQRSPSPSSSTKRRQGHRPPPLDLRGFSNGNTVKTSQISRPIQTLTPVVPPVPQMSEQPKPNRHQLMAGVESTYETRVSDISYSDWIPPADWAVSDNESESSQASHKSQSRQPKPLVLNEKLKPFGILQNKGKGKERPQSKQLPSLPPCAVTFSSKVGGIVNRPDPRDRRSHGVREVAAEGGFWVNRTAEVGGRI